MWQMMTSKLSARSCQQPWCRNTGPAKVRCQEEQRSSQDFSAKSNNFEFLIARLFQIHERHKNSTWVMYLKAARCVHLMGSCPQKLLMAKAKVWEQTLRKGTGVEWESRAQIQLFITTACAELFKGNDKSMESRELLKTSFWDRSKKHTRCFQVVSHKIWSIFG